MTDDITPIPTEPTPPPVEDIPFSEPPVEDEEPPTEPTPLPEEATVDPDAVTPKQLESTNVVMEIATDADGNPVRQPATDGDGNPLPRELVGDTTPRTVHPQSPRLPADDPVIDGRPLPPAF